MFTSTTTTLEKDTLKVPAVTDLATYSKAKATIEELKTDNPVVENN